MFVTCLLLFGVIAEYFKIPLGGGFQFGPLVGRVVIAAVLLVSFPEASNAIADVTDALASRVGDMNSFKNILSHMGAFLDRQDISVWTSLRDTSLVLLSFLAFLLLYFSVYFMEAMLMFTWVILYAFSPLLIALYVLPATAQATTALYRSLIEASCWKVVWSLLATLLWSSTMTQMTGPEAPSFLSIVLLCVLIAVSVLATPLIVHALAGAGMSSVARQFGGSLMGAAAIGPSQVMAAAGIPKQKVMNFVQERLVRGSKRDSAGQSSKSEKGA